MGWLDTILDVANVGMEVAQLGKLEDLRKQGAASNLVQAVLQELRSQIFNYKQAAQSILDMEAKEPIISAAAMQVLELQLQDSGITPELFSAINLNDMEYVASTYKFIRENSVRMRAQLSTTEIGELDSMVNATLTRKLLPGEISVLENEIQDLLDKLYEEHPKDYLVDEEDIDKIISLLKEDIRNLRTRKSTMSILGWRTDISGKLDIIESLTAELENLAIKIKVKRSQLERQKEIENQ